MTSSNQSIEKQIVRILNEMSVEYKVPFYLLPVYIQFQTQGYPAFTTAEGIFIDRTLIEKDPNNLKPLLLHEVLHHVVRDARIHYNKPAPIRNIYEDYKINQVIIDHFKLDVRHAVPNCLYDPALGKLPLKQLADKVILDCTSLHDQISCKSCDKISHPAILQVAWKLREQLPEFKKTPTFYVDALDKKAFINDYYCDTVAPLLRGFRVDPDVYALSMYKALTSDHPVPTSKSNKLSNIETCSYGLPIVKLKGQIQDESDALFVVFKLIHKLNNDENFQQSLIRKAEFHYANIDGEIKYREDFKKGMKHKGLPARRIKFKNRSIKWLRKRRIAAMDRVNRLKNETTLTELLLQEDTFLHTTKLSRPSFLQGESDKLASILPRVKKNQTIRRLYSIVNRTLKDVERVKKMEDKLEDFSNWASGEGDQGERISIPKGSKPQEKNKPHVSDAGLQSRGRSLSGSGEKVSRKKFIDSNSEAIEKVMFFAREFETRLANRKPRRSEDNTQPNRQLLAIDDDIGNVLPSELALLGEATKLLFLQAYAEHSLYVSQPPNVKRLPILIAIDGSGSMKGKMYDTAGGFALAISKLVQKDNRGFGVLSFSDKINSAYVLKSGQKSSMTELLDVICNPTFGGTNFDAAFRGAYDVKQWVGWKNFLLILITDGDAHVNIKAEIQQMRSSGDVITAIVVDCKLPAEHLKPPADHVFKPNKKGVFEDLVKVGASIL